VRGLLVPPCGGLWFGGVVEALWFNRLCKLGWLCLHSLSHTRCFCFGCLLGVWLLLC